jgi:predicted GTPase
MDVTGSGTRLALVSWANRLYEEVADRAHRDTLEGVRQAVANLESDRFVIAILGKAKRGKSTLLNVLLGRNDDMLAPVDKLPASSAVSRFRWADKGRATVVYRDGNRQDITFEQVREYVTEESNPENSKGVDVVEIEGPFAGLEKNVELVDTPGAASIHEHHDAILHAFIPQADAVIFLVTARMPLDQDELDLLRKIKAADIQKVFFAINRVDEATEADLNDAIAHNRTLLARIGIQVDQIHRISAKKAFSGDICTSGISDMMAAIANFLTTNKVRVLNARFVSRVTEWVRPVAMSIELEAESNNKSKTELQHDLSCLRERKRHLESERTFSEREFRLAWGRAVDDFEHGLAAAKVNVDAEFVRKINSVSVVDVTKFARELPTWLTKLIEDQLSPVSRKCEERIREACERLQADYPSLDLHKGGAIVVRTRAGSELITGSIGGLATAAAGVGVVASGSAAAATIAAANLAALHATTSVAAPSVVSGLFSLLGLEILAPLATGTATVAAPTALTTTPLWVALAGPLGWTLAGIGVLAVPFSWRLSKIRLKDKLETAGHDQVEQVFSRLAANRVPALRSMCKGIAEEFQVRLDRQLAQTEAAISSALDRKSTTGWESARDSLAEKNKRISALLAKSTALLSG